MSDSNEWLLQGMQIKGKYTNTIRRVEYINDDTVVVSHKDRRGKLKYDTLTKNGVLKYWRPYSPLERSNND